MLKTLPLRIVNRALFPTIIAIAGLALLVSPGCGKVEGQGPPSAPPPASVTSIAAPQRDVPLFIDEIGRCVATEVVSIQPQAKGRILEIHFKDGADLKKGDRLFTIDPRPYQVTLQEAEAALVQNKAELEQAEANLIHDLAELERGKAGLNESEARLDLSKLELDRAKDLVKADALAMKELDQRKMEVAVYDAQVKSSAANLAMADAKLKNAHAAVAVARAKIESTQATIAAARLDLEYTSVRCPIDGRAGQRLVDVGNIVDTMNAPALLVIQRVDPIYADFTIPEAELGRVRQHMSGGALRVEIRTADNGDAIHAGELTFLDNAVLQGSGTIKLRATIPNPSRALWPGQFVKVRLILRVLKDAILVPAQAVQVGQSGKFVYVVKSDSTVELRPVQTGQRHDDQLVISEGLGAGDRVVVTGQLTLFPGAKVADKSAEPSAVPAGDGPSGNRGKDANGGAK